VLEERTSSNGDIVLAMSDGLTVPFLVVGLQVELAFGDDLKILLVKGCLFLFGESISILVIQSVIITISLVALDRGIVFDFALFIFIIKV